MSFLNTLPPTRGLYLLVFFVAFRCVVSSFRFRCLLPLALLLRIAGGACADRLPLVPRMAGCEPYAG